jgi:ABC-type sugar transport system substrate-binding protein
MECHVPGISVQLFIADDTESYSFNSETGSMLVSSIIAANSNIKYWLITSFFDDYAVGAAQAAEAARIDEHTVVMSVGGAGLIQQWDTGKESSWKASVYIDQNIFAEPVFSGLYAMMSGVAMPETLWPDCVSPGSEYAVVSPAGYVITKENYKEYLEWTDASTGSDRYNYSGYRGSEYPVTYHRDDME